MLNFEINKLLIISGEWTKNPAQYLLAAPGTALVWFKRECHYLRSHMGATFSITLATDDGVKNIPAIYLRAVSTMGANGFCRYPFVILPDALPSIITGMELGWSFVFCLLLHLPWDS